MGIFDDNGVDELMKQPRKGGPKPQPVDAPLPGIEPTPRPAREFVKRGGPAYVWVTWITALLAGEEQCEWHPWARANYKLEKRPDPRSGDLSGWAANHTIKVETRAAELRGQGWTVRTEDQNSWKYVGESAILSGKPDIVAVHPEVAHVLVEDVKTGREKKGDWWQVLIYLLFLPKVNKAIVSIKGTIRYNNNLVHISQEDLTDERRQRIYDAMKRMGSSTPPSKTPSVRECNFCDIALADCPENKAKESVATASGKEF